MGIVDIMSLLDSLKIDLPIVLIHFFCILRAVVQDLKYLDYHEWIKVEGKSDTVGITDHAQDYLGDVVYVELLEMGAPISQGSCFGVVESVNATSDIYCPIFWKVVEVN